MILLKLFIFIILGIPWIAFEGKFDQMPKSIYETWHAENPYIINYLSEKVSLLSLIILHSKFFQTSNVENMYFKSATFRTCYRGKEKFNIPK